MEVTPCTLLPSKAACGMCNPGMGVFSSNFTFSSFNIKKRSSKMAPTDLAQAPGPRLQNFCLLESENHSALRSFLATMTVKLTNSLLELAWILGTKRNLKPGLLSVSRKHPFTLAGRENAWDSHRAVPARRLSNDSLEMDVYNLKWHSTPSAPPFHKSQKSIF